MEKPLLGHPIHYCANAECSLEYIYMNLANFICMFPSSLEGR